jgi:hypothetical protein
MKSTCLGFCTALALATVAPQTMAAVIISEIMFEVAGSDDNREWVELYNTGDTAVDIAGWRLRDEDAGSQPGSPLPAGTTLGAKQAIVLIETQATFLADWGSGINYLVYPGMGTSLNMGNTPTGPGDEALTLVNAADEVVDVANYDNESPWPSVTNATATSIYVLPGFFSAAANDLGSSWGRSTAGTHGAVLGNGRTDAGSPGVVIPEPASLALALASAIVGLTVRRRLS